MKIKKTHLYKLFLDFLRFGCFTFGGGWSIVGQMQSQYVDREHTITDEELLDLTSVSRSIPGVMVANVAMLYGYRAAGVPGGLTAVLGLSLPPFLILSTLTFCYTAVKENPWVVAAMGGIRAAVVPIMFSAMLGLIRGAFHYRPCVLVTALGLVLYLFFHVSCIWLVVLGGLCGLLLSELQERKGRGL